MLSYMIPVEEKPPPAPNKTSLQLELEQRRHVSCQPPIKSSTVSSESSVSSITSSEVASGSTTTTATPTDKPKPKLVVNGTKHVSLKRVSFGSSKGSMVETLIYESPLQEEPEASPILEAPCPHFLTRGDNSESEPSKRVRVTFFESERPLILSSPEPSDEFLDVPGLLLPPSMTSSSPVPDHAPPYNRQTSTDSGWDNPFRPDGDLSREADEIVELIKGGKPITPTPGSTAPELPSVDHHDRADGVNQSPAKAVSVTNQNQAPNANAVTQHKIGANGTAPVANDKQPASVEVKRETAVQPVDASQVEHIVLKKKPKCKCCVIQ